MNPAALALTLSLAAGVAVALQAPMNGALARATHSPVSAALISFLVGSTVLAALIAVLRPAPDMVAVRALPWWAWAGGAFGAFYVAAAAFAAPRIGVAATLVVVVAGQLAAAVALDHVGAFGLEKQTATPLRLLGVALVAAGVLLVRKF